MILRSPLAITFYESSSSIICSYFYHTLKVRAIGFLNKSVHYKAMDDALKYFAVILKRLPVSCP